VTNEEGEEEKIEGDVSSNIQELEKVHETGCVAGDWVAASKNPL
jgi:hypothetical protein